MARITIDLSKGIFEIEGSEDFVEKRFADFQPQLISAMQQSKSAQPQLDQESKPKRSRQTQTKTKKRTSKTEVPDIFKEVDMLPTKSNSGIVYSKLKNHQDRLLWSLVVANDLGIDGLENSEIVWLTDKSGVGIPTGQITINYQRNRDKGFTNQSTLTGKMRITDEGIEHINSLLDERESV